MAAGEITLAQYRKNVRGLVGDASYDLTLVDQAINWFINEVHFNHRIRYMETNDQLYVSAGDTEVDWPDDFQTRLYLTLISPQVIPLKSGYVEYDDFMSNYANYLVSNRAQIGTWTDFGNGMRFAAPSLTDATLNLDYLRRPTPMIEDTDTTDMPDQYEELISKGALARLMEINEDYAEAVSERNNLDPQLTAFVRNEGRGGAKVGPTTMRTNRGRLGARGPFRADRDF
jgi:hypothetical protein